MSVGETSPTCAAASSCVRSSRSTNAFPPSPVHFAKSAVLGFSSPSQTLLHELMLIPRRDAVRQHGKVGFSASRGDSTFPSSRPAHGIIATQIPPGHMGRAGSTFFSHCPTMAVMRKEKTLLHHSHSEPSCMDRNLTLMSCRTPRAATRAASVRETSLRVGRRAGRGKKSTKKKSVRFERHTGLPGLLKLDPAAVHCFFWSCCRPPLALQEHTRLFLLAAKPIPEAGETLKINLQALKSLSIYCRAKSSEGAG